MARQSCKSWRRTRDDNTANTNSRLFMHGGHTNRISDFSFNRNDPWLTCSAAEDNLIQVWRTAASLVGREPSDVPLSQLEQ